ncbi:ATPases involved in chromosome partitioning [Rubrobacter radiotolerans]|uniref:ATPases involved in chromosome partitioning n=1 Tax=Rubrobacter radiotolerans TaxID=42256 RepID=A0A023X4U0_RUBRA|nr:ATPases involved in chromosome partitioning [Rubrobacter radiotolerans]SMC06999.1 chromosome partitioning protein [Rubrobacter radiotolerans DSM 5868]
MRKVAFTNAKGGVAKTTTCVNVGAALARRGHRTLLIDCDTQGQVTKSLGVRAGEGLAELVQGEAGLEDVQIEARENLFVIAGGGTLSGAKRLISRRDMRSELVLSEALADLRGYDFVLLDTAPSWDVLNVNCLFYVEELLIPVSMEVLALQGIGDFLGRVRQVQLYREGLRISGIIPTFYDARVRKSAEILEQLEQHFPGAVWPAVRYNSKLSEAPGFGQHIFEYAKKSNGAADHARLAERLAKGA